MSKINLLRKVMAKYLILCLVIFLSVFCKQNNNLSDLRSIDTSLIASEACFDSTAVDSLLNYYFSKDTYYHALLKKWQESADWQEQGPIDDVVSEAYMCSSEIYDVARRVIEEHYHFRIHPDTPIEYTAVGEQKEHWLVNVRRRGRREVIRILISRVNKDVLSIESYHAGRFASNYLYVLRKLVSNCVEQQWFNYNKNIYKDIDSIEAITIAVAAVTEYHSFEMLPVGAMSMGVYKEHWIVYLYPIRPPKTISCYTDVIYYDSAGVFIGDFGTFMRHPSYSTGYGNCYWEALSIYVHGGDILGKSPCPPIFAVLISRENGQVLFMGEVFNRR
ncbi:MAG: hypothetical protein LBC70_08760 [Chitinispirillales bacterium]|nr:hypothetical protein [Chitinispirillales bacterium]